MKKRIWFAQQTSGKFDNYTFGFESSPIGTTSNMDEFPSRLAVMKSQWNLDGIPSTLTIFQER